jgi:nitrite reductase (NO-forming)
MTPVQTSAGPNIPVGPPRDAKPAPPVGQGPRRTWHLRANAVVGVYVLLAVAALALHGSAALPMPRWLAVHLLLLGAVTNAIVTWTEHFAVALLRATAPSRRVAAARLAVLNVTIVGVLVGVAGDLPILTMVAATLLALVVLAHLASLVHISRHALRSRFAGTIAFYVVAGLALAVGIALGTTVSVADLSHPVHEQLHAAHVHANVLGWIGLTVLGTLFTLWPTVLRTRMADDVMRTAKACLVLVALGLTLTVTGLAVGSRLAACAGLLAYAAGVIVSLQPFVVTWRRKAPHEGASWSMAAAVAWLLAGVLADVVVLATAPDVTGYVERLDALVPALAVGFALQMVLGALAYLLPVVLGGGPTTVRASIGRMSAGWVWRVVALNVGVLAVWTAAALNAPTIVHLAAWALVAVPVLAFGVLAVGAVAPAATHSPLGGVALGLVMTLVPVLIAVSGQTGGAQDGSVALSGGTQEVAVTLVDMDIRPAVITVPAGTTLRLVVTNKDSMRHDVAFPASSALPGGMATPLLLRGQTSTIDLGVVRSDLSGWCTVPGHKAAGMTLDIKVIGTGHHQASSQAGAGASTTMPGMGATTSQGRAIDVHGQPGPGWKPFDATLPPAPAATVHRLTLHAIETDKEVAPGVRQRVWTFGGTVPAPTLRGKVGDTFIVTLINDGTMDHGIDFHAGQGAPDEEMRSLAPGESLVYRFTAQHSGAWLYHCSTMPMLQHIANGMYGAVIIDPPQLDKVDHEYVLVASQLYVGTPDGGADPARLRAGTWDAAMFNGYPDQYVHAPLKARVGDRVRWWVVAAGPSEGTAFHIVGTQFDTVFSEGAYQLRRGNAEHGAAQVLDLAPAQGGFVEQTFTEAGHYPIVDHDMRRGENGAAGVVEVTR